MAVFLTPFITPGNYTYDSDKIEFSGGMATLRENLTNVHARWHLNESTGTNVPDDSGNNRDGTTQNMEAGDWQAGKLNNCLVFGGTDEYVDCGGIAAFERTDTFSINCWAKWSSTASMALVSKMATSTGRGWLFFVYLGQVWILIRTDSTYYIMVSTDVDTFNDDTWRMVSFTYDGSNTAAGVTIYVNGTAQATTTSKDNLNDTILDSTTCQIGARDGSDYYTGSIDEITIFETELTQSQITYLYNSGTGRENWYRYNDSPGIHLTDGHTDTYVSLDSFSEVLGGGNEGSVAYQVFKFANNWKYWDGGAWVTASAGQYNTAAVISANISTFPGIPDAVWVRAFLISDGTEKVEVDQLQLTYSANLAPLVNAGTNKACDDEQTISPFSDCTFSDPDGTVDHAYYKVDGEVTEWTEIPQGGYGTLLEAVQAFFYQYSNIGTIVTRLQVENNETTKSDDSLDVVVSKHTITFSVLDWTTSEHLTGITFVPGDGAGEQTDLSSPFDWDYSVGDFEAVFGKTGYSDKLSPFAVSQDAGIQISLGAALSQADIGAIATAVDAAMTASHGVGDWGTGSGGSTAAVIADAVWDEPRADHQSDGSVGETVRALDGVHAGGMAIERSTNQLVIYERDDATEVLRQDLENEAGGPSVDVIFRKRPV